MLINFHVFLFSWSFSLFKLFFFLMRKLTFFSSFSDLQIFFQLETFCFSLSLHLELVKREKSTQAGSRRVFFSHKNINKLKIVGNWRKNRVRRKKSSEVNSFCDKKLISSQAIVKQRREKSLWLHNFLVFVKKSWEKSWKIE